MTITLEGISLHVSNFEESYNFYAQLPGVEVITQRPGEFVRFKIGDGFLHLVKLQKPGFHIEINTSDVETVHQELLNSGFTPTDPKSHPWGKRDFNLVDPNGNLLEFGAMEREA